MSMTDALIPVYEAGKPVKPGFRFQTDDALVCMALNIQFENFPENFGHENIRELLKLEIREYLDDPSRCRDQFGLPQILPYLSGLFEKYDINPVKDLYVAFLGGSDYFGHSVFGEQSGSFRNMFTKFRDFNPQRECALNLQKSRQVQDKFDFVLSGNVLNDPRVINAAEVFEACARILKPGGVALHGLDYSNHHYGKILCHDFHAACGQARIDGNRQKFKNSERGFVVDAIALQQQAGFRPF